MRAKRVLIIGLAVAAISSFSAHQCEAQLSFGHLSDDLITETNLNSDDRSAVVLIHGWNPDGNDNQFEYGGWPPLVNALQQRLNNTGWKLLLYHWEDDADTGKIWDGEKNEFNPTAAIQAAENGFWNGKHLGQLLDDLSPDLRKVHFIAHSAGSWVAREAMLELLRNNSYTISQFTLLDPFIPDELAGVSSPLSEFAMSDTEEAIGGDRIFRLENYYSDDFPANSIGFPIPATQENFNWGSRGYNLQVDHGSTGVFGIALWYDYHSGPVQFFSDTVRADAFGDVPLGLENITPAYDTIGWFRSLFLDTSLPTITQHPQSSSIERGESVVLSAVATSPQTLAYQWFKDNQQISNATGSTYSFTGSSFTVGDYVVRVTNVNGLVFSDKAHITLSAASPPTITSVAPRWFTGPTEDIVITGTGFTSNSRLTFDDGVNLPYTDKVPTSWTATQLTYHLSVGLNPATWTVQVVNDASESQPYSFYVLPEETGLVSLSINGPAAVAENSSGQFTATAYFTDGSQQNVTSNVEWMDSSGAATISSSGILNAGSVSSDTEVTVSASYTTGGIMRSASTTTTIVNGGSGGGTTTEELIVNGDFANGGSGWILSGAFQADSRFTNFHDGPGYAYLATATGAAGNNLIGTISQTFTIPANATEVSVEYWHHTTTTGTEGNIDKLTVRLLSGNGGITALYVIWNGDNNTAYERRSFDVTTLKGQTVTLEFSGTTSSSVPTTFRIDDVSVAAKVPVPKTLLNIGVAGPTTVQEGTTAQYDAIGLYSDGSISAISPTWSEDSGVTSISSSGVLSIGNVSEDTSVTVTATFGGFSLDYEVTVVNTGSTFSYLAISGPSSIDENSSGQFTATAIFSDGSSQPVSPNWMEDSIATTISNDGLLTTGEVNDDTLVTVSATHTIGGVTRTAEQEVLLNNSLPPTLTSLTIDGPGSVIEYGVASFTATAGFSDGTSNFVNGPAWMENSDATSISVFGLLSAGEVANDTLVTVSFSYTLGEVTVNASKDILVLDGGSLPEMPYEAKAFASISTSVPSVVVPAPDGGLVLFGNFTGTIIVGGQEMTSNGGESDFYGLKLDSNNQVVWVRQFGGENEETVNGCERYPEGGWVIAGEFRNTGVIGDSSLISEGHRDAYLARLDEDGNVLWARRGGGGSIDYGDYALTDPSGNCYLVGKFTTSATFTGGGSTLSAVGSRFDLFVAKYNAIGEYQWAVSFGGPEYDDVYAATSDSDGNVYVGGIFEQQTTIGAYTFTGHGSSADWDGFIAKFSPAGDVVWAKQLAQPSGDFAGEYLNFLVVSSNGACFFGGSYDGPMTLDGYTLPLQTATTAFAGKINNAGTTEWLQALPAEGIFHSGRLLVGAPLSDESLIVGGTFYGTLPVGSTILTNGSPSSAPKENLFWAKLNPAGTPQWGISASGDHSGNIYTLMPYGENTIRTVLRFDVDGSFSGLGTLTPGNFFVVDFGPKLSTPTLGITFQSDQLIISWPVDSIGFQLESSSSLLPDSWSIDSSTPTNEGDNYVVIIPVSNLTRFFRLERQE